MGSLDKVILLTCKNFCVPIGCACVCVSIRSNQIHKLQCNDWYTRKYHWFMTFGCQCKAEKKKRTEIYLKRVKKETIKWANRVNDRLMESRTKCAILCYTKKERERGMRFRWFHDSFSSFFFALGAAFTFSLCCFLCYSFSRVYAPID